MNIGFPSPGELRSTLQDLLGRQVATAPRPLDLAAVLVVASYVSERGDVVATATCDLGFACAAGAALCLLPPRTAEQVVATGELDEQIEEPLREILNITAQLFNGVDKLHVKLDRVYIKGRARPPAPVISVLRGGTRALDLEVQVSGYPNGHLCLRAA